MIEIGRDFKYRSNTETVDLLVKLEGKRIIVTHPDRETAFEAHKNLLKADAEYLLIHEEAQAWRWSGAERMSAERFASCL
jgi:hypothetical protein